MTQVYWLETTEADLPAHDQWLSAAEMDRLRSLRFPKRRAEWRLGRWAAKRSVCAYLDLAPDADSLATIEVRPEISGAPVMFIANERAPVSISLSHREGTAFCSVVPVDAKVGCDLERVELRSHSFVEDFFTAGEYAAVCAAPAADRSRLVTLIWSAKESALKVLQEGLRLDTRCVQVVSLDTVHPFTVDQWHPLLVEMESRPMFHGWWQFGGTFVRTVLTCPAPLSPVALRTASMKEGLKFVA